VVSIPISALGNVGNRLKISRPWPGMNCHRRLATFCFHPLYDFAESMVTAETPRYKAAKKAGLDLALVIVFLVKFPYSVWQRSPREFLGCAH